MAEIETTQEELELTSEQKKVLGQVYRLILSWDREAPEVFTNETEPIERTSQNPISKKETADVVLS